MLDRSDLLAALALLISFASMWLSISELRIMREEANLMRSQQKASVWPYLDVTASFAYADEIRVTYAIENKGIGPALVNKIRFLENGKEISSDYTAILDLLLSTLAAQGDINEKNVNLSTGINNNVVLSPGEKMVLLSLVVDRFDEDQVGVVQFFRSHSFSVCYSSIYEDSWIVEGTGIPPVPTTGCPD
jgi:hypothetical protein